MDPLTASITYTAMQGGASAGAGGAASGAGAAAMSNPIAAAAILAALATAYGTSPTVRKKTNKVVKKGWEGFTNPIQHFGDNSEKDTMISSHILKKFSGQPDNSPYQFGAGAMRMGGPMDQSQGISGALSQLTQQQDKRQKKKKDDQSENPYQQPGGYGGMGMSHYANPFIPYQQPVWIQQNPDDLFGQGRAYGY